LIWRLLIKKWLSERLARLIIIISAFWTRMKSWIFLSLNYQIWVIKLIMMINSLLMLSFRRSNQYHNRLLLNKKKMSSLFHIQRCNDQFWWKIDFWISALSSHVHLLNVSLISILLFDTRNMSSSKDSGDFDWFKVKSYRIWIESSCDSVCQWRMFRTSRWNLLNWLFDKWLLTISDYWLTWLMNHWV
jgi:hypothetical protein